MLEKFVLLSDWQQINIVKTKENTCYLLKKTDLVFQLI